MVVCPAGIDIRDGSQLECINCGLCADACDEIMVKVGRPKGLIAYDTDHAVAAREAKKKPVYKFVRARTIYYVVTLSLVSAIMVWGLFHRATLDVHVLRDRNPLFVRLHDGGVRDGYTLKIANHGFEAEDVEIRFSGVAGVRLKTPGADAASDVLKVRVAPNQIQAVRVFIAAPAASLTADNMPAVFAIKAGKDRVAVKTNFLSGAANAS